MKKLALYGYGVFGKRTAESFRFFWGGEYEVTAVFDRDRAGEDDEYWSLRVLSPERIGAEYKKGIFEAVMVCIGDEETRTQLQKRMQQQGIPVFLPGKTEDFAEQGAFREDGTPEIAVDRGKYSLRVYENMFGAVADFARCQIVFLFDENGRLNIGNYRTYLEDYEPLLRMPPFRRRNPVPEKVYMKGSWCVIAKAFSTNYWHFTFEAADCVFLLERAGYRGKYIFNDVPFARELLQIMGVSPDRLVGTRELDIHRVYAFEKLYELNHAGMRKMECSAEVISEMADFFRAKLKKEEDSPRRIYIKRIGRRKLLNGEETAVRNGFRVIVPEEYGVREQMTLFHNADIVLCPHGANSTNCLYMHKGAVFAELFSDSWQAAYNPGICAANGVHYLRLVGKARSDRAEDIEADYSVDAVALQNLILEAERILAEEQRAERPDTDRFR